MPKTIKLLQRNTEENLHDNGCGNDLAMTPKSQATKVNELTSDF